MKRMYLFFVLLTSLFLQGCIGEDIINDAVAEEIRFLNTTSSIEVSESYKLDILFFNNIGEQEEVLVNWFSDNPLVATVDSDGTVLGISEGETSIRVETIVDDIIIDNVITINVTPDTSVQIVIDAEIGRLTVLNPIESIDVSETYLLDAVYLNEANEEENIELTWHSDNMEVAIVNTNGLVSGISNGSVVITVQGVVNGEEIEESITIEITEVIVDLISKSGTIITTSSYVLEGSFTLSEIENTNNLELSVQDNYRATTSLPGLYVYLSNNPNSIANALEIGAVETFSGEHSYTINNEGINDYAYVLYWCKPFGVKVGEASLNN